MFDFIKRLAAARAAQKRQHIRTAQLRTFILEQILTPSGFIDNGDDLFDADTSLTEIDDSLSEFKLPEGDALLPDSTLTDSTLTDSTLIDNALPETVLEEIDFQAIPFIDTAEPVLDFIDTAEPVLDGESAAAAAQFEPNFEAGVFTVGDSGQVSIDYLFDGGGYKGELALFTLEGMDEFDLNDADSVQDFIQEAAHRALQNDADSGYVAISDRTEGARFSGQLGEGRDWNAGDYQGIQTFELNPGDEFALMLVPHGTVERVYNLLLNDQSLSSREQPLFSLATINPDDSFQLGQIASIVEGGDTFVMEDIPIAGGSDSDYNDLIFQIQGAAADDIPTLEELPSFTQDWRDSDTGQALLSYTNFEDAEVTIAEHLPDPVRYAIERAIDLDSHDPEALAATQQWVVGVSSRPLSPDVLHLLEAENLGATGHIPNTFLWEFAADLSLQQVYQRLDNLSGVEFAYPLLAQQHELRMPTLADQWHLAEISPIWDNFSDEGITGEGVTIGIVDDGLGYEHPNLSNNYRLDLSRDFHEAPNRIYDTDPLPKSYLSRGTVKWQSHGTSMAGIAAGVPGENGPDLSGVAPGAAVVGLRLFEADSNFAELVTSTDLKEADSLSYLTDDIDIYNNSWGPEDKLIWARGPKGPSPLAAMALHTGVTQGRNGRGSIFVWAAGNGGRLQRRYQDRVDYDGYASSRYTIAVAAIDHEGRQAAYGEPGASLLVSAPSSGSLQRDLPTDRKIVTARLESPDDGDWRNDYTVQSGGTSAAAAFVSGVVALMLEANPNLTWRDVQHILVDTARQTNPEDEGWTTNGARVPKPINYKYGFGAVDAAAAVKAAQDWQLVGAEVSLTSGERDVNETIPTGPAALERTVTIDENMTVESVEVMFDASHDDRGDLEVVLVSPDGTESILTAPHKLPADGNPEDNINPNADYDKWLFTSMRHWGESSYGDWTLRVSDKDGNAIDGTWNQWQLNLHGANPVVTLEASDPHAREGGDVGTMTIRRTGNPNGPLTVNAILNVAHRWWRPDAIEGQDYRYRIGGEVIELGNSFSVTIPAGEESVAVAIEPLEDNIVEWPESVTWQLQSSENYELNDRSFAEVRLWDNEPPQVRLYADAYADKPARAHTAGYISEAGNAERFRFRRIGDLSQPLSLKLVLEVLEGDVTAADYEARLPGSEYGPLPETIEMPAVTRHSFWSHVSAQDLFLDFRAKPDGAVEGTERIRLAIEESGDGSYTILDNWGSREIAIGDDDGQAAVTIVATDLVAVEGGDGNDRAEVTVYRQGNIIEPLAVTYWISPHSGGYPLATPGEDYELPGNSLVIPADVAAYASFMGRLEIPAGESSASLAIQPLRDGRVEPTEYLRFVIQPGEEYSVGARQVATVRIEDEAALAKTLTHSQHLGGADAYSAAQGIAIDGAGRVYIAGRRGDRAIGNGANIGDVFVAQANRELQWAANWPQEEALAAVNTAGFDEANGIAVAENGTVYVTGWTDGDPAGDSAERNGWIARYNADGSLAWKTTVGTGANSLVHHDIANGSMTVDAAGNVYLVGYTFGNLGDDAVNQGQADAWVAKYDASGEQQWLAQLGSRGWDEAQAVAVDGAGNVYITGKTLGQLGDLQTGDADIWAAKYNSAGERQWLQQFGTDAWEEARSIAVDDAGHVYLGGQTKGWLGETYAGDYQDWAGDFDTWFQARHGDRSGLGGVYRGEGDVWVAQLDSATGTANWKRLLGTAATDGAMDVVTDGAGNVYLTGFTRGELVEDAQVGGSDVFAAKYNVDGALQWRQQLGSAGDEVATGIALENGSVYLTGVTDGDFAGATAGGESAWVVRLE